MSAAVSRPAAGEKEAAAYAEAYYGIPYDVMRTVQAYFVGDIDQTARWLSGFVDADVRHVLLRFATTDLLPQLGRASKLREKIAAL